MHPDWLLTPQRAAVHLPTWTAVLADLHLGYSAARRQAGEAVPDPGPDESLNLLRTLLKRHPVRSLVVAGDLFERAYDAGLAEQLRLVLDGAGVEFLGLVPGNHDRRLSSNGPLPVLTEGIRLGGWHVLHGDGELPDAPVVCGHFHPCLRRGRLAAPCFLVAARRIILPAFSRDAAGVSVFGDDRWRDYRCLVPAGDEVLDFGLVNDLTRSRSGPRAGGPRQNGPEENGRRSCYQ
jgi:metallophosphoesterase superfamily enzyme